MTDIPELPEPPADLTVDQYEACRRAIIFNVEQALLDPLVGLSDETEQQLVALAFNDVGGLERMEREIREQMRQAQYDAGDVRKFSLGTYKRAAKQLKDRLREIASNMAKRAARNAEKMARGGSLPDTELAEVEALTDDAHEQARLLSNSPHLMAVARLTLSRKGRVWYDTFYNAYFTDWDGTLSDKPTPTRPVDDVFLRRVHGYLHTIDTKLAKTSYTNSERALYAFADNDHRNEPRDWLTSLKWDGTNRLETWLSAVYGVPQDDYHAAVGRCWFVSLAARIMDQGCKVDTMPVLCGPQGTAKSTSLEIVGGKWYATINVGADKYENFVATLSGLLVAEVAELDAISNRKVEITRVKTLLSTREDRYRPPYGRTAQTFSRTAVLAGTTNETQWHRDETGGRRFWPIVCAQQINLEWLKENREQLFAEALVRYQRNEKWWDVPEEEQRRRILDHHADDPWKEKLEQWLQRKDIYRGAGCGVEPLAGDPEAHDEHGRWGTLVTTSRLACQVLNVTVDRQNRVTELRVAQAMKSLGWERRTVRTKNADTVKAWIQDPARGVKESENGQKILPFQ